MDDRSGYGSGRDNYDRDNRTAGNALFTKIYLDGGKQLHQLFEELATPAVALQESESQQCESSKDSQDVPGPIWALLCVNPVLMAALRIMIPDHQRDPRGPSLA